MTTDAVLTGAWRIPRENRVLFQFVNVSDQPVKASWRCDPRAYGLADRTWRLGISRDGQEAVEVGPFLGTLAEEIEFLPQSTQAWELRPAPASQ